MATSDPLAFTTEETDLLLEYLLAYTNPRIGGFLAEHGLRKTGNKQELRERTIDAIREGRLSLVDLVEFLDAHEPWGKQHVFLLDGVEGESERWMDATTVEQNLERAGVANLLERRLPVALPERLSLTEIRYDGQVLTATAVARRDASFREPMLDFQQEEGDGRRVEYRAYVHETVRNTVRFEWDLVQNRAMLQVTQLPSGHRYEDVREEFAALIVNWLDLQRFTPINLRRAIHRLHEHEENGNQETRSRAIDYETLGGRRFGGRSGAMGAPLLGEPVTDDAMRNLRIQGVGRYGNFYWRPQPGTPVDAEVHIYIIAHADRINFPTPQTENVIRYVLDRIRHHCC